MAVVRDICPMLHVGWTTLFLVGWTLGISSAVEAKQYQAQPQRASRTINGYQSHCVWSIDVKGYWLTRNLDLLGSPSGIAISSNGTAYVTCGGGTNELLVLDGASREILARASSGHGSTAPVLSPDATRLYVCNRFDNDVTLFDTASLRQIARIPVVREPVAADISRDGRHLLVANHLPAGRANVDDIAAAISVIDTEELKPLKEIRLPNGSGQLKDLRVSPDGKYAAATHLVASHFRATTKLQSAWINGNALTIIDVNALESLGTILLDEPGAGAANPWGLAWSSDGRTLVVTHAGTHEVSAIDFPKLLEAIQNPTEKPDGPPILVSQAPYEGLAETLPFLVGARQRIKLAPGDLGPRSVEVVGGKAYVLNYFSQTLSILNLSDPKAALESIPLDGGMASGTNTAGAANSRAVVLAGMSQERRGEFYFHDASICFQGWQSCASCHPGGARMDGLNWDLLNDGIGNPKNTKSLLLAFQTPPAMSLGVRNTAEAAVRAGLRHILFTEPRDDIVRDISAYLKSLKPEPSPYLVDGQLSESARRGAKIFARAGCAECHPPPLFTDLERYDVGTRAAYDEPTDRFDVPTLVELWRTAPYLHDGSAATIRDVLITRNPKDDHGVTSSLSPDEIADLCAYLRSL